MEAAEDTLTYQEGLDDVREQLKKISKIASRTSRDSINRMRGLLPTELAESQVTFLRGKFEAAREVLDTLDTSIPVTEPIYSSVESGFDNIEETRALYEQAYDQEPDAEATHELYEEYLDN